MFGFRIIKKSQVEFGLGKSKGLRLVQGYGFRCFDKDESSYD